MDQSGIVLTEAAEAYIGTYNKFINYQNRIEEAWSSIDVALKPRFNLIPNLVSAIKGYSEHESEIFENKTNQMKPANSMDDRIESESQVTHSLSSLLTVAEDYPDLKARVNFLEQQKSLAEIETELFFPRSGHPAGASRGGIQR
ncbi:MAG: LemA family protein [Desulfobulbaceae bacterium]|nr:MAG: LemA family protein [Desulfobulbaceae bacterium]